jgi:hypothetical protein
MPFEIPDRTATILIPEGEFEGAEVTVSRNVSLGLVFDIDEATEQGGRRGMTKAVASFVANVLRGWNLTRNGEPLPATAEEMLRLPPDLVVAILRAWGESMKGTPLPLDEPSESGEPSESDSD